MSVTSLRVLYSKCSQKQNCSVVASTNVFGDACPGTHKYLEAHYQCIPGKTAGHTFCMYMYMCMILAIIGAQIAGAKRV